MGDKGSYRKLFDHFHILDYFIEGFCLFKKFEVVSDHPRLLKFIQLLKLCQWKKCSRQLTITTVNNNLVNFIHKILCLRVFKLQRLYLVLKFSLNFCVCLVLPKCSLKVWIQLFHFDFKCSYKAVGFIQVFEFFIVIYKIIYHVIALDLCLLSFFL